MSDNSTLAQRYRIMSDNSGHEYAIKLEDEDAFLVWLIVTEDGDIADYDGPDFEENRIDGRFTFIDPRNE
jgi:hypothetical protein